MKQLSRTTEMLVGRISNSYVKIEQELKKVGAIDVLETYEKQIKDVEKLFKELSGWNVDFSNYCFSK